MKITELRVTLGYTYNLGDYSNIRPEISLSADVTNDHHSIEDKIEDLYEIARDYCHNAIDLALESEDRPAHFSIQPRYVAYAAHDEKLLVMVPVEKRQPFEEQHPGWKCVTPHQREGFRLNHLIQKTVKGYPEYTAYSTVYSDELALPDLQLLFSFLCEE